MPDYDSHKKLHSYFIIIPIFGQKMILSKSGYFETLNPISKTGNILLLDIGKMVLLIYKQFQRRGSRYIWAGATLLSKWTRWLMRRHTVSFGYISSLCLSDYLVSILWTSIWSPSLEACSLSLSLAKQDKPSHSNMCLSEIAPPFLGGGACFFSLSNVPNKEP